MTLPILLKAGGGGGALSAALDELFAEADRAVRVGSQTSNPVRPRQSIRARAIPDLLAVSGLHHYLIRAGLRTQASIVVESGEPRVFTISLASSASAPRP